MFVIHAPTPAVIELGLALLWIWWKRHFNWHLHLDRSISFFACTDLRFSNWKLRKPISTERHFVSNCTKLFHNSVLQTTYTIFAIRDKNMNYSVLGTNFKFKNLSMQEFVPTQTLSVYNFDKKECKLPSHTQCMFTFKTYSRRKNCPNTKLRQELDKTKKACLYFTHATNYTPFT